jgi:hypothetical protein
MWKISSNHNFYQSRSLWKSNRQFGKLGLRQSDYPELVFPKLPFVYLKEGFKGTIPVPVALENFIRDAGGPISYQKVRDFWVGKVFMKVSSFHEVIQRATNIIRAADRGFIHVDKLSSDHES